MAQTAVNYKAVVFYGVVFGVAIIALLYFLKVEPLHTALSGTVTFISSRLGNLGIASPDISKLVDQNKVMLIGTVGAVVPLIYTTIKARLDAAAKKKALEATENLLELEKSTSLSNLDVVKTADAKVIADLKAKLAEYENDPALGNLQTSYSQLQTEKTRLQSDLNALTTLHTNTIKDIWASSGNRIFEDALTGEKYKILEIVKKVIA